MSDFWRNRSVLITGATGFLGLRLATRLASFGTDTTCVVRNLPNRYFVPSNKLAFGDVTDQAFMERAIGESQAKTVFHLAAQTQVCVANRNPGSTFDTNIRGTWSVLEACRRSPLVEQIVVSSSDKAYGDQLKLPYTEDSPLLAVHPYDVGKACADMLTKSYASTWGLPVAITRCGNLFGGGDRNWSRLVPGTIRRLLNGDRPVIHGDGDAVRDWLYVEDAVDAYLLLAEKIAELPVGEAYNLSLESPMTISQIVGVIIKMVGIHLEPIFDDELLVGEIQSQSLSCIKACKVLGWKPKHSMEAGLQKTVAWYRENL